MEKSMINKGAVFYENGTWSFLTKTVNCNTYTIEYEKKTGFCSVEEAKQAQEQENERYQKSRYQPRLFALYSTTLYVTDF